MPNNYRGISLINVISKLFAAILNNRLIEYVEDRGILGEEQGGFRPNRSTSDQIFILKLPDAVVGKAFVLCSLVLLGGWDRALVYHGTCTPASARENERQKEET